VLRSLLVLVLAAAAASACDPSATGTTYGHAGTTVRYQAAAAGFYALPYPNDLRYDAAAHTIDLHDFPNPKHNDAVAQMVTLAGERRYGFGVMPVAMFAFDGALSPARIPSDFDVPPTDPTHIFFVNIDADSPRYGERVAALGHWFPEAGPNTPANLLTFAPWAGVTLAPNAIYAAIVLRTLEDAGGRTLGQDARLGAALAGDGGARGDLRALFAPLAAYLATHADLKRDAIAAATVFTTGDPAALMQSYVADARNRFAAAITEPLTLYHSEAAFCAFAGKLRLPQFQNGTPPYGTAGEGRVVLDGNGRLVKQRNEDVRFVITLPTGTMPAQGFPLLQYTHGSGGVAAEMIDRGRVTVVDGPEEPWRGPAYHAALQGYAAVGQAMPISPDRVAGATSYDYLQLTNLHSMAGNFIQGTIEMALTRDLLYGFTLPAGSCPGLATGGMPIRFDPALRVNMGQSMGAMYTNLYSAIATDTVAVIPTGSGGYWSFFLFGSELIPDAERLLKVILGVPEAITLDHLYPVLGLFQQYAEAVDPVGFVSRITREPLAGVPAKHLYVPFGYEDKYFNRRTQRAIALGYGVPLAGDPIDAEMGRQLSRFRGLKPAALPAAANVAAGDGRRVTAVAAQFPEDEIQKNGHTVYAQNDAVLFQYTCFLKTLAAGAPAVPAANATCP
jgi:hypothetical protein